MIIDCSGSIREANEEGEDNWQYVIDFAVDLVTSINVGKDETHVAAVSFGKHNYLAHIMAVASNVASICFHDTFYYLIKNCMSDG